MEDDSERVSRPWARIFDLILSQYGGYDDEKILSLTLERVLQMVEVIWERRREEAQAHQIVRLQELELAVKYVSMSNAVAAQSKKGAKWLEGFVRKMDFVKSVRDPETPEQEEENLPSTSQVMAAFGAGADGQVGKRVT